VARRDEDAGRCGKARGGWRGAANARWCRKVWQGATEVQGGAARHNGGLCGFGVVLGVFGSYLHVKRSDYGAVATNDDFLVTRGLAVKGIMWLRK